MKCKNKSCSLDSGHRGRCVANTVSVANTVANSMDGMRVELWRQANRERYNARQRELMRKKRASAKSKQIIAEGSKMFAGAMKRLAET